LTGDFLSVNILSEEPSGAQKVNEEGHEGQMSRGGAGLGLARATHARLIVEDPMSFIFVS
jgi:hypothetical protein